MEFLTVKVNSPGFSFERCASNPAPFNASDAVSPPKLPLVTVDQALSAIDATGFSAMFTSHKARSELDPVLTTVTSPIAGGVDPLFHQSGYVEFHVFGASSK